MRVAGGSLARPASRPGQSEQHEAQTCTQLMPNEFNKAVKAFKRPVQWWMRTPGLAKRARLGLQRNEQTGQALEGLLHIQHAFCDGSCGGAKIAESPGGAVPAMVRG